MRRSCRCLPHLRTIVPENYRYLAISILGPEQPNIVTALSQAALQAECNILDSQMMGLGSQTAMLMLADGNWNTLTRFEKALNKLATEYNLAITVQPTSERAYPADHLPYIVDAVAIDQPGIVARVAEFFTRRSINISDVSTSTYTATRSNTLMFSLHMAIHIPSTQQISVLREEFMDLCDRLNLDAVIEPYKN